MPAISSSFAGSGPFAWLGLQASISSTTFDLNTDFVFGTAGDNCLAWKLECPVSQSAGALKLYARLISKTGSPSSITCALHAGPTGAEDAQRPSSTEIAAVTVDCSSASADTWIEFAFTGITLAANTTYWLLIYNETATPASNYVSFATRRYNPLDPSTGRGITGWTTTAGFSSDPVAIVSGVSGAVVLKLNDGSLIGNPYVLSTIHASNTNLRGGRWTFPQAVKVAGCGVPVTVEGGAVKLYQGATLLEDITIDRNTGQNGGTVWFSEDRTFAANTAYDVVFVPVSNSGVIPKYDAGETPPADVSAALIQHLKYVDGTTPGSLTAENGAPAGLILIPAGLAKRETSHVFG